MGDNEPTIELQCSKCKTTSQYERRIFVTFRKARCVNCGAIISHVNMKFMEKLQILMKKAYEPRTKEWASSVFDIWAYLFGNRDEFQVLGPQTRFDVCIELMQTGLISIPAKLGDRYVITSTIPVIISEGFDSTPFLPTNPPQVPSEKKNVFAVHYKMIGKLLEKDEYCLHFEFGAINLAPYRWRIGTIVLTTKRLIVIGCENRLSSGIRHHIKYPPIDKFHVESYLLPKSDEWQYEVRPEPQNAAFFTSLDYFYLQDLDQCRQTESTVYCTFRNQRFVVIEPYGLQILNPLSKIRSYQGGWNLAKTSARQKEKTGVFGIEIILGGEADYQQGIHGPNKRAELLAQAIKEVVNPTIDTGSSYL